MTDVPGASKSWRKRALSRGAQDVWTSMPGVQGQLSVHRNYTHFRMIDGPLQIGRRQRAQQPHPAVMQRLQQGKLYFDWRVSGIAQLRPEVFFIGLDGGLIFGERQ